MKQTFDNDLARGEKVENDVLKIIQKKYPKAYKIEGYCKAVSYTHLRAHET